VPIECGVNGARNGQAKIAEYCGRRPLRCLEKSFIFVSSSAIEEKSVEEGAEKAEDGGNKGWIGAAGERRSAASSSFRRI
jgi:hypothetical protein